MRILVTGASGAGTSTLAEALGKKLGIAHFDADDYFWLPTDPPYKKRREGVARLALLLRDLNAHRDSTIAGSIGSWGAALEDSLDLIVFLYADTSVRVERLQKREMERYGKVNEAFLTWASEYDAGPSEGRSLSKQRAWLSTRICPVLELSGEADLNALVDQVEAVLKTICQADDPSAGRA
jgi:uridine kinase